MAKFIGWLKRRASGRTLEVLLLATKLLYQPNVARQDTRDARTREMVRAWHTN
jgi:hypothetical protein